MTRALRARGRRLCHSLAALCCWRSCRSVTVRQGRQALLVACTCGRVWYATPAGMLAWADEYDRRLAAVLKEAA